MLLKFADLTLTNKGSLYSDLYKHIKEGIEEGKLKKGEKLPSVREASRELGVSRTTVENAYTRLCIEGFCEALPQKGYFITGSPKKGQPIFTKPRKNPKILYDFSSKTVDAAASDTDLWKRLVRSVLWDNEELNSYGDPQGEPNLRKALAEYSYKARGVIASADNIVIGAGIGPLLNILCGLLGRDISVGFENEGFRTAERIFSDYGIKSITLSSDNNGALPQTLEKENPDILFLLPSAISKLSATALSKRRNFFVNWADNENRLIIEDDYNGELRYSARSIPAFQGKSPQNTVYIGSFSKLLLPSVRIAYMVLPDFLARRFRSLSGVYNQTCGKIEQLALEKYIVTGALEKHLRRLRRLYYSKSQLLSKTLENELAFISGITLYESSLTVEVKLNKDMDAPLFLHLCEENGIRISEVKNRNTLKLCFAGISFEKIPNGVKELKKVLDKF